MLPNWLYGKSKSKLASILGGGGTPADYDEVKAQVTQLTQDSVTWDNLSEVGAVNRLEGILTQTKTVNTHTFTPNSDGSITITNTGITTTLLAQKIGQFVGDGSVVKLSGAISGGSSETYCLQVQEGSDYKFIYDTGNGAIFQTVSGITYSIYAIVRSGYSMSGTIHAMIADSSYNGPYVPYAMTNRELTEKLTADANLGTAISLSTYAAYSNMYTAPSDGYVHFQSAASGSTARTIYTYSNNTAAAADPHFTHSTSENNKAFEIYVRKGLKIYVDGLQSGDAINFYPLT